jgi:hypothetical protein
MDAGEIVVELLAGKPLRINGYGTVRWLDGPTDGGRLTLGFIPSRVTREAQKRSRRSRRGSGRSGKS